MIIVGLTGSIGMGKSTTAQLFADAGAAVWDADAAVHRLYAKAGAAVEAIRALYPDAIVNDAVDRARLREAIMTDATLLKKVESVVHPLVGEDRAAFLDAARLEGAAVAILDIPLIFETGNTSSFDQIVVVSAPAEVQRARVLERPGMTEAAFEAILAKQVPDAEKRAGADYIIDTSRGIDAARADVVRIMSDLTGDPHYA